jgi:hypothetical protein
MTFAEFKAEVDRACEACRRFLEDSEPSTLAAGADPSDWWELLELELAERGLARHEPPRQAAA